MTATIGTTIHGSTAGSSASRSAHERRNAITNGLPTAPTVAQASTSPTARPRFSAGYMSATAARARFVPPYARPNSAANTRRPASEPAAIDTPHPAPATASSRYASASPGRRPTRSIHRPNARAPPAAARKYSPFITPTAPSWPARSLAATLPTISSTENDIDDVPCAAASSSVLRRIACVRGSVGSGVVAAPPDAGASARSVMPLGDLDHLLAHGVHDRLHARVQVQLLEDVADVVLDRVLRDVELLRDVAIVQPLRDELQDLHLAVGELRRGDLRLLVGRLADRRELGEELARHRRTDP